MKNLFSVTTCLSSGLCFVLFVYGLFADMSWHITVMLFISFLIAAGFFLIKKDNEKKQEIKLFFIILFGIFILPCIAVLAGANAIGLPLYFILFMMFTVVILHGKIRIILLTVEMPLYVILICCMISMGQSGSQKTAGPDSYFRLLFAMMAVGVIGGGLLRYRNESLLREIINSKEQEEYAKNANYAKSVFLEIVSHQIETPLDNIMESADTLMDMDIAIQRKEDVLFIERSAKSLQRLAEKLAENKGRKKEETEEPEQKEERKINRGKFICPAAKILVVDDNLVNLDIVKSMIEPHQCEIISAMSGEECLEIIEKEAVDMIFLDYMMPEMNGVKTLKKLRTMKTGTLIPVVALTADEVSGAKEMFINAGFDGYMTKPVELRVLQEYMRRFLAEDKIIEVRDETEN